MTSEAWLLAFHRTLLSSLSSSVGRPVVPQERIITPAHALKARNLKNIKQSHRYHHISEVFVLVLLSAKDLVQVKGVLGLG